MTILLQRIDEDEDLQTVGGFGAVQSEFGNLPLCQLSYHARMVGLAVRTTILQTYYNPFDEAIEAEYIFPLEIGHSVIACEMRVGERIVRAELKERGKARREYAEAIANGHRAALLEENRPETFSMRVGNIPPGEAIQICIQTVSQLSVVHGEWTLRLQLVVAPRYTSGLPLPRPSSGSGTAADTDQVPDASYVTPPVWLPGFASPIDLQLVVDIDQSQLPVGPDWIQQLMSTLHTALLETPASVDGAMASGKQCRITLLPGERVNRDFILRGRVLDAQASCSVVSELDNESNASGHRSNPRATFAVTIVPPRSNVQSPKQVIYLLDRSGSMEGWKIASARRGLCRLLDRLDVRDQFRVIAFDNDVEEHRRQSGKQPKWQSATDPHRFDSIRWLGGIDARGGTELDKALEHALRACREIADDQTFNPAIVLVTDGQISGEDALLRLIDAFPQDRLPRLFCLGVDRAVNASVLQRISRRTGGTFELVESEQRLDEVLQRFGDEIGNPALTGITISAPAQPDLQLAPAKVRSLYSGRSQTIYGRCDAKDDFTLTVSGLLPGGNPYSEQLTVSIGAEPTRPPLLRALWGKEQVRTLEDDLFASGTRNDKLNQEIIDCSLNCGVLSRLTAFVAVDATEKVTDGHRPHSILNLSELPEGWSTRYSRIDPVSLLRVPRMVNYSGTYPQLQYLAAQAAKQLLDTGAISAEQLAEADRHSKQSALDVCGALVHLGYATHASLAQSIAAVTHSTYVALRQVRIDESVIQLIPESVARENHVLPLAENGDAITIVVTNPNDVLTVEKLQYILNRKIVACCGAHDEIASEIDRYYGAIEGESADSCLQEYTDYVAGFEDQQVMARSAKPIGFGRMPEARLTRAPLSSPPSSAVQASAPKPLPPVDDSRTDMFGGQSDQSGKLKKRSLKRSSRMPRKWSTLFPSLSQAPNSDVIERTMHAILDEAVKLGASHVLARFDADRISIQYIINAELQDRERLPGRLWDSVRKAVMQWAGLDPSIKTGVQAGPATLTMVQVETELQIHAGWDSFMIELPAAKNETDFPEAVEQWFAANQVS